MHGVNCGLTVTRRHALGCPGGCACGAWRLTAVAGRRLAVAAAEQEVEAVQVIAQLGGAVGGMAGEAGQRCAGAGGIAGEPVGEEQPSLTRHKTTCARHLGGVR